MTAETKRPPSNLYRYRKAFTDYCIATPSADFTPSERLTARAIIEHMDMHTLTCKVSNERIAAMTGQGKVTVRKNAAAIERHGIFTKTTGKPGQWTANRYQGHLPFKNTKLVSDEPTSASAKWVSDEPTSDGQVGLRRPLSGSGSDHEPPLGGTQAAPPAAPGLDGRSTPPARTVLGWPDPSSWDDEDAPASAALPAASPDEQIAPKADRDKIKADLYQWRMSQGRDALRDFEARERIPHPDYMSMADIEAVRNFMAELPLKIRLDPSPDCDPDLCQFYADGECCDESHAALQTINGVGAP